MKTNSILMKNIPLGSFRIVSIRVKSLLIILCLGMALSPQSLFSQPLANGQSKFLGNVLDTYFVYSNYNSLWNELTPGNAGKWGSVENTQGQYSWGTLDTYYNFAITNWMAYKHHNFVWGNQQPSWISPTTTLDSAAQRAAVEKWIDTVGQRYTSMTYVDVVNEPFHAVPSYANALGGTGKTGWDWVVTAFQWARQYCFPSVQLLINEYNILQDNNVTTNYIKLVDTLKVRGLIDGIGIQGHYFEFRSPVAATSNTYVYDVNTIKANLNRLAATGLPIYISEFDINEPVDSVQLAQYKIYFPIFWSNPAVKGITLWGYMQGDMWQTNAYLIRSDGSERPAMQWLRIYVATPAVISPNGMTNQPRDVTLLWHPSAPATSYRVQVATDSAFSSVVADTSVTDTLVHMNPPLAAYTSYYWHVSAVDSMGASVNSVAAQFITGSQVLAVERLAQLPKDFVLLQNYPNPFNPSTEIRYEIPDRAYVTCGVFDLLGREVASLVNGEQAPGHYMVTFNSRNLPSGIYFYRLQAGQRELVRRMVLLK
jgi:endo-1,4-beta-xylanase